MKIDLLLAMYCDEKTQINDNIGSVKYKIKFVMLHYHYTKVSNILVCDSGIKMQRVMVLGLVLGQICFYLMAILPKA